MNASHLGRLLIRFLNVTLQILQQAVQAVQVPLERLTEHRDVVTQLGGSGLPQYGPPAIIDFQEVDGGVALFPLQLVLILRGGTSDRNSLTQHTSLFRYPI